MCNGRLYDRSLALILRMNSKDERCARKRIQRPSCRLWLLRRDNVIALLRNVLKGQDSHAGASRSSDNFAVNPKRGNSYNMASLRQFSGQRMDVELGSSQERKVDDWNENVDSSPLHEVVQRATSIVEVSAYTIRPYTLGQNIRCAIPVALSGIGHQVRIFG